MESYSNAIALQPDYVEALNNRGNVLRHLSRAKEALVSYDKAIVILPHYAEAHNNRGIALRDLNRDEEALASYDRALALKPDYTEAYNNKGILLTELRQLEAARKAFEKAIKIAPMNPRFYYHMAECRRFTHGDPYFQAMKAMARDRPSFNPKEQIFLHFALGGTQKRMNRFCRSFLWIVYIEDSSRSWVPSQ